MAKSGYQIFQDEAPTVAAAFNGLVPALIASSSLDGKTANLIYVAMKAATDDPGAVLAHVPMVKSRGANREEVRGAILLTLTVVGLKGVNACLAQTLDVYDRS